VCVCVLEFVVWAGRKEKAGNTYTLKHLRYTNTQGHKWALKWN